MENLIAGLLLVLHHGLVLKVLLLE